MKKTRKRYSSVFKTKVSLEAIKGLKTLTEIGEEYGVHPLAISKWKSKLMKNANGIFTGEIRSPEKQSEKKIDELYRQVGKLQVENDWLKKKVGFDP